MLIQYYVHMFIFMELIFNLFQLKSTTYLPADCTFLKDDDHFMAKTCENTLVLYISESSVM